MDMGLDKRPLVLVVDDDETSARGLARLLRDDGYSIEIAVDGAAALARLTQSPVPEAIVTDIHLPHADGFAIGRFARMRRRAIPVFLVTGYPHTTDRTGEPLEGPPPQLLTKPLDYTDLASRLADALGLRRP